MPKPRSGTSYRLSEDAQVLLVKLASRLGLSKTSVLEMAIRKLAYVELGDSGLPTGAQPVAHPVGASQAMSRGHIG